MLKIMVFIVIVIPWFSCSPTYERGLLMALQYDIYFQLLWMMSCTGHTRVS